jgi:hypothetical protein
MILYYLSFHVTSAVTKSSQLPQNTHDDSIIIKIIVQE